jgi:hypothetical protein
MGLGHRARQSLADPLLLGDVVVPGHHRASLVRDSLHRFCGTMADSTWVGSVAATGLSGLS